MRFILLLLTFNYAQSQTYFVDYDLYLTNTSRLDSLELNIKKIDSSLTSNFQNKINYKLIHSANKSIFKSFDNKTIFNVPDNTDDLNFLKDYKLSDYSSVIYKDFESKKTNQREFIYDKSFIISDIITNYKWILTNKKKKINSFNCFSADTIDLFGNKVTAWFTLDIPISNGPGNFHGLPGLIILVETDSYVFEMSSLKTISKILPLAFEEKGKDVNMFEFMKIYEKKILKK
jgi:GLPGLI family protein